MVGVYYISNINKNISTSDELNQNLSDIQTINESNPTILYSEPEICNHDGFCDNPPENEFNCPDDCVVEEQFDYFIALEGYNINLDDTVYTTHLLILI